MHIRTITRVTFVFAVLFAWAMPRRTVLAQNDRQVTAPWWQTAVFYQVYPRSFFDTNGDGIGDLRGITAKLDYLQSLGVDAIWLNPVYPSPQIDTGYDIADFLDIDEQYGHLADFDRLIHESAKRKIRVVMDMVLTHTSNQHPWFIESSSSRANPKADWYIWSDGKDGDPPNNWKSFDPTTKGAWEYVPARRQYYYHLYDRRQPALNWRSPGLRRAMLDACRFWLARGVAGFRLDSAPFLYVDAQLRDNIYSQPATFDEITYGRYTWNQPEYHATMRELREVLASYPGDPVLIGETVANSLAAQRSMWGEHNDEIQLPMNFGLFWTGFSAPRLRRALADWETNDVGGWPLLFFSNHDTPRSFTRMGDGLHNEKIARVVATLLLTMRGTPIVYQGEELGLEQSQEAELKAGMEHIGHLLQPPFDGRDGARTPMQWTPGPNAGFTAGTPWLPVEKNYPTKNVESESASPNSLLQFYRTLIRIRRSEPALMRGAYLPLNTDDGQTLSYMRGSVDGSAPVLVVLNLSAQPNTVRVETKTASGKASLPRTLLAHAVESEGVGSVRVNLQPFGIWVGEIR